MNPTSPCIALRYLAFFVTDLASTRLFHGSVLEFKAFKCHSPLLAK